MKWLIPLVFLMLLLAFCRSTPEHPPEPPPVVEEEQKVNPCPPCIVETPSVPIEEIKKRPGWQRVVLAPVKIVMLPVKAVIWPFKKLYSLVRD